MYTTPTHARAWTIPSTATAASDIVLKSLPVPQPGPKQVLIRIQAAALNYRDILVASRSPYMPGVVKEDLVPGSDGAGVIVGVGDGSAWAGMSHFPVLSREGRYWKNMGLKMGYRI